MEQFLADFLLLFLRRRRTLRQKRFLPRKYPFRPRLIALSGQNGRITQRSRSRDMRICYWAAHCACKGILPRFRAHAHNCEDTERLFSHGRVFRAICDISSGFATTPSCLVRANAHYTRVRICARCGAPDHVGATAFTLRKTRRTFLSPKLKSAIAHHILQKSVPMSFLAARRFGGTAFCRRKENRAFHYAYFTAALGIDPSAPSQTAVFAAISGFAARIVSFPVCGCVSKNRRRFRALNTFREVVAVTATHIRRPFFPPLQLLTQGFKARPQLYARALSRLVRRPRKPLPTF